MKSTNYTKTESEITNNNHSLRAEQEEYLLKIRKELKENICKL